jgi:hypothetical protein
MSQALALLRLTLENGHCAEASSALHDSGFLKDLFSGNGLKAARVHPKDLEFLHALIGDTAKLMHVAAVLKRIIDEGKTPEALSYSVYAALLSVLVASIARLATDADKRDPWLHDVVAALKNMFKVFHGSDIDARLKEHKDSPFYTKMKAVYARVINFFKRLWRALKNLIKKPDDYVVDGEIDPGRLYRAGISHLATLDDLNSKIGGTRVSLERVPGLPVPKTNLRKVQMDLLDGHEPDRG